MASNKTKVVPAALISLLLKKLMKNKNRRSFFMSQFAKPVVEAINPYLKGRFGIGLDYAISTPTCMIRIHSTDKAMLTLQGFLDDPKNLAEFEKLIRDEIMANGNIVVDAQEEFEASFGVSLADVMNNGFRAAVSDNHTQLVA